MIKAEFFKDRETGKYRGFSLLGHAGYAKAGEDIICASVSALSITIANSIETFSEDDFREEMDEKNGMITFTIDGPISEETQLLIASLRLGLEGIRDEYSNKKYIEISIKEV